MLSIFRNHWFIILRFIFGLLIAVVVLWGLKVFIEEGDWIGLSVVATLLLAIAAFWTISENRYRREKDRETERKARSTKELCEWAEEALRLYYLPYNYYKEQIAQGLIGLVTKNMLMSIAATIIGDELIEPTKRAEEALTDYCNMTKDIYYQKKRIEPSTREDLGKKFEEAFYPILTYLYVLRYWDYDYCQFLKEAIENGKLKPKYVPQQGGKLPISKENHTEVLPEINIKAYLINWLTLPAIFTIILAAVLMGFLLNVEILPILAYSFGIISFLLLVVVVGLILAYNPQTDKNNRLVKIKGWVKGKVEKHKTFQWLQGHRAIEFFILVIGITFGLCSLGIQLIVAILSPLNLNC